MNERIKQLAEQAGSTHKQSLGVYQFYSDELEKFAELIVRECHVLVGQGFAPPQEQRSCDRRTWVGLTNNDLQPIADEYQILFGSWVHDFARAIEAKLKQKNGFAEEKNT